MSETPAATPAQAAADTASPTPTKEETPAQETDWKAEARKWESRAKENSSAAEKLTALEESQKTEAQKQADALAKAQAKVKEYEQRDQITTWSSEIVKDSPIPASALRGNTREELKAHFEQLKALVPTDREPAVTTNPAASGTPSTSTSRTNADLFAEAVKSHLS